MGDTLSRYPTLLPERVWPNGECGKICHFFSANCDPGMKEEKKQATGIITEALSEKYLGLPIAVGQSTTEAFESIPTKI